MKLPGHLAWMAILLIAARALGETAKVGDAGGL
jgi:hypothetical protein